MSDNSPSLRFFLAALETVLLTAAGAFVGVAVGAALERPLGGLVVGSMLGLAIGLLGAEKIEG